MQYFGKGPGFAEPWLSTKTGGGGGGGGGGRNTRTETRFAEVALPVLIRCFITVQICPTPTGPLQQLAWVTCAFENS